MKKYEFIDRAVGLPWIDRACSWSAMDCWGVVVMYFRYVYGEELPVVEGYITGKIDVTSGMNDQLSTGKWRQVDAPDGDCIVFMQFNEGVAQHVGVIVDGKYALHSAGHDKNSGQVRCDRLDAIRRFWGGEMRFYRYEGCTCW